jgi:hypothetical protein
MIRSNIALAGFVALAWLGLRADAALPAEPESTAASEHSSDYWYATGLAAIARLEVNKLAAGDSTDPASDVRVLKQIRDWLLPLKDSADPCLHKVSTAVLALSLEGIERNPQTAPAISFEQDTDCKGL